MTQPQTNHNAIYDLVIVGSGAAGLSAAIYAARYRLKLALIGAQFGGETALAGKIEELFVDKYSCVIEKYEL